MKHVVLLLIVAVIASANALAPLVSSEPTGDPQLREAREPARMPVVVSAATSGRGVLSPAIVTLAGADHVAAARGAEPAAGHARDAARGGDGVPAAFDVVAAVLGASVVGAAGLAIRHRRVERGLREV